MRYRECKACGDIQNPTSVCGGCLNRERDQQGVLEEQEKYEQEIINENN